uniref:Uncharacterized protein n=1 Tax=Arion vulgaris TaxID=1028688 RepID=A0A0B7AFF4_9EUPU
MYKHLRFSTSRGICRPADLDMLVFAAMREGHACIIVHYSFEDNLHRTSP